MSTLIPTPPDHNHTTEVFKRTLSSAAFLCNANDAVARHKTKKRKPSWLYRAAIVLCGAAAFVAMTGCHQPQPVPSSKESNAAKRACGGLSPIWIDANTIECVKETK